MSKRKVLIFGATGEIGSRIANLAVRAGHEVIGVTRGRAKADYVDLSGIEFRTGDKYDEAFLAKLSLFLFCVATAVCVTNDDLLVLRVTAILEIRKHCAGNLEDVCLQLFCCIFKRFGGTCGVNNLICRILS